MAAPDRPIPRLGYTVDETLATGVFADRNRLYKAIRSGELKSWLDGRCRMILAASLHEYIARQIAAPKDSATAGANDGKS